MTLIPVVVFGKHFPMITAKPGQSRMKLHFGVFRRIWFSYPMGEWSVPMATVALRMGACISEDGITWKIENEIILRDDAFNKDLGYPVSVELEPGIVLTAYYQPDPKDGDQRMTPPDPKRHRPDILGMIWRVPIKGGD